MQKACQKLTFASSKLSVLVLKLSEQGPKHQLMFRRRVLFIYLCLFPHLKFPLYLCLCSYQQIATALCGNTNQCADGHTNTDEIQIQMEIQIQIQL